MSRVGIWGWSGGGSNTLNAMFRRPDVYNIGIAVAPKPQPHLYNAWFQEIYMETLETNPEGYRQSAPINFAEGLKGDLLIIHGTPKDWWIDLSNLESDSIILRIRIVTTDSAKVRAHRCTCECS